MLCGCDENMSHWNSPAFTEIVTLTTRGQPHIYHDYVSLKLYWKTERLFNMGKKANAEHVPRLISAKMQL